MINSSSDWVTTPMQVLNQTPQGIVISKGPVITALTNIGSPVSPARSMSVLRSSFPSIPARKHYPVRQVGNGK